MLFDYLAEKHGVSVIAAGIQFSVHQTFLTAYRILTKYGLAFCPVPYQCR